MGCIYTAASPLSIGSRLHSFSEEVKRKTGSHMEHGLTLGHGSTRSQRGLARHYENSLRLLGDWPLCKGQRLLSDSEHMIT